MIHDLHELDEHGCPDREAGHHEEEHTAAKRRHSREESRLNDRLEPRRQPCPPRPLPDERAKPDGDADSAEQQRRRPGGQPHGAEEERGSTTEQRHHTCRLQRGESGGVGLKIDPHGGGAEAELRELVVEVGEVANARGRIRLRDGRSLSKALLGEMEPLLSRPEPLRSDPTVLATLRNASQPFEPGHFLFGAEPLALKPRSSGGADVLLRRQGAALLGEELHRLDAQPGPLPIQGIGVVLRAVVEGDLVDRLPVHAAEGLQGDLHGVDAGAGCESMLVAGRPGPHAIIQGLHDHLLAIRQLEGDPQVRGPGEINPAGEDQTVGGPPPSTKTFQPTFC